MLQVADLGEAVASPVAKRKRMRREKVRSSGHVQSLELPERLGEPQLRSVRAFRSGKNILWIHEDDVAWLCTYLGAELGTGGVGPIEDADGQTEDDCPENAPHKPIKGRTCRVRSDFNGAWEGVVARGPNKGARIVCKVSSMTAEKWAGVSKVHNYTVYFVNASFEGKKIVARHFLELHLQRLTERDAGAVIARSCWGQRFTCGHSRGSCGRGRRSSGGGACNGASARLMA